MAQNYFGGSADELCLKEELPARTSSPAYGSQEFDIDNDWIKRNNIPKYNKKIQHKKKFNL